MLCLADTQRTLLLVSKVLYKEIQLSAFIATLLLLREGWCSKMVSNAGQKLGFAGKKATPKISYLHLSGFWEKGKGSGFWEKGKGRKASDGERHGWLSF
jgi:hypothetical protein